MIEYIPQVIIPVLVSFFTGAWAILYKKQQTLFQRYHAVNDGMKCLLRAEIIRDHSHYVNMGYIPMYAMQNVIGKLLCVPLTMWEWYELQKW